MARKRDRVFALTLVILFFATSFGISFGVLWQMYQDNHDKDKGSTAVQSPQNGSKLQGTKLEGFTPVEHTDQLQVIDERAGTGTEVKAGDTVTVDYTGAVAATGVIFQSSLDTGQPASLSLGQVIKGWQDGIPGMKIGGKRRLVIPAVDAYGTTPPEGSGIPANADLVFDITLQSVGQ
jgi:FKBP-type peptidyl-prolyl cis-trans isomerase